MVGYNVQPAVDTKHHLIIVHEVINDGVDRSQLSSMAKQARAAMGAQEFTLGKSIVPPDGISRRHGHDTVKGNPM